jgi:dolichol-phosphate mannosyltransferase
MAFVSVVVPVYWNAGSLPQLKSELEQVAESLPDDQFEFMFVDDGSGDASYTLLEQFAQEDDRVRVLRLSRNFGSNPAILAGLSHINGDCTAVISADLQDPPSKIPEMVEAWRAGSQVVMAARATRHDPLASRFFASAFNYLFKKFVFSDFPRHGFDFMLLDRQVVKVLVDLQEKNSYIFGQVMWVGFERSVIYYERQEREHGQSRWTTAKKIKYFIDAFSAFSYLPLRLATMMGFLMAGLGFLYTILIVFLRLTSQVAVTGWASTTVVVLLASGTQLILLGILGEYLWRVLDESRNRPPYVIRNSVNLPAEK